MQNTEKEKAEFDQLYHVLTSLAQKGKPVSSEELKHVMKGSSMTRKRHPSVHLHLQAQALSAQQAPPQATQQAPPQATQQAPQQALSQASQASQASQESHDFRKRKKKQANVGKTVVLEYPLQESTSAQHMVHDILRMAESRHISKRDLWEALKKEMGEECKACLAPFVDRESLANHVKQSPLCQRWLAFTPHDQCRTLQGSFPLLIQGCVERAIVDQDHCQCRTCLCRFSTKEELYQHLSLPTAILCNRYACYEFKKIVARI
jgi:hypothetical protein